MTKKITLHNFALTGYDATPMVPCSELSEIFNLESLPGVIFCSREEEAIAVGAGLQLAGRCPLVMMQSSGLMSALNTVGSLLVAYAIPLTMLVAMRGGPLEKNPTQIPAGRAVVAALTEIGCHIVHTVHNDVTETLGTIQMDRKTVISDALRPTAVLMI